MKNLDLNVGKACNNACVFCGNGTVPKRDRAWVPRERLLEELERAAGDGIHSLSLLGGEITVYPHALHVVEAARRLGFRRIALCTNGRRLADERLLEAFIVAGVTRVALSIHSHIAADEDRLNDRQGAFAQKLNAIENLARAAALGTLADGFALNSCIHGLNHRSLCEMATFFHARGVRDIRFNFVRPEHQACGDMGLVPPLRECVPELVRLVSHNERTLGMSITFGDIPLCMWPDQVLRDEPLIQRYLGELRDLDTSVTVFRAPEPGAHPDRFDWRERRAAQLKGHVPSCEPCRARDQCEGPWLRYLEMYGAEEFRPLGQPAAAAERSRPAGAAPPVAGSGRETARRRSRLHVMVSSVCNNRCLFCLEDRQARAQADFATQARALDVHNRRDSVLFTCGEPTTSERLLELISRARSLGYHDIELVTNGRRLAYPSYCRRLLEAGVTAVTLSIHGATAKVHDGLTRSPGSFAQSTAGLKNMSELRRRGARLAITTSTVLTRRNLAHIRNTVHLLASLGANRVVVNYVEPAHEALRHFESLVPRMSEAALALGATLAPPGLECRVEGIPPCLLRRDCRRSLTGEREAIFMYRDGEVRSLEPTRNQTKGPACGQCVLFDSCDGVWIEYARRFGWDEFRPVQAGCAG